MGGMPVVDEIVNDSPKARELPCVKNGANDNLVETSGELDKKTRGRRKRKNFPTYNPDILDDELEDINYESPSEEYKPPGHLTDVEDRHWATDEGEPQLTKKRWRKKSNTDSEVTVKRKRRPKVQMDGQEEPPTKRRKRKISGDLDDQPIKTRTPKLPANTDSEPYKKRLLKKPKAQKLTEDSDAVIGEDDGSPGKKKKRRRRRRILKNKLSVDETDREDEEVATDTDIEGTRTRKKRMYGQPYSVTGETFPLY